MLAWPRVYADLRRLGGRGLDAAEHLRETMATQTVIDDERSPQARDVAELALIQMLARGH